MMHHDPDLHSHLRAQLIVMRLYVGVSQGPIQKDSTNQLRI